jgi:hypothetical protein
LLAKVDSLPLGFPSHWNPCTQHWENPDIALRLMTVLRTLSIFAEQEKLWNKERSTTQALEGAMGTAFSSQTQSLLYIFGIRFLQLLTTPFGASGTPRMLLGCLSLFNAGVL